MGGGATECMVVSYSLLPLNRIAPSSSVEDFLKIFVFSWPYSAFAARLELVMSGFGQRLVPAQENLMRAPYLPLSFAVSCLLLTGTAAAHFTIIQPPPASTTKDGKGDPPCGPAMNSGVVTAVTGGSEIDLVVDETVPHPGF
ncbi:MAG TPA: hypothetical protein VEQ59_08780, partial [Polyangiaceae bacterium]|nr:hypothetical protein [Polyangiaceae bacterium]